MVGFGFRLWETFHAWHTFTDADTTGCLGGTSLATGSTTAIGGCSGASITSSIALPISKASSTAGVALLVLAMPCALGLASIGYVLLYATVGTPTLAYGSGPTSGYVTGMDQLQGIDLTLDLLLGLLLALLMAYMDHEGLGHAHERQNQALDHYSQNLDLDRSNQFQQQRVTAVRLLRCLSEER
ncbi:hypothetical protein U1Q18_044136 [Sarracenia purpurea var. burkii]